MCKPEQGLFETVLHAIFKIVIVLSTLDCPMISLLQCIWYTWDCASEIAVQFSFV